MPGWRLDRALAAALPTLSRERLKALIRSGAVGDRRQGRSRSGDQGAGGEELRVAVPEPDASAQ